MLQNFKYTFKPIALLGNGKHCPQLEVRGGRLASFASAWWVISLAIFLGNVSHLGLAPKMYLSNPLLRVLLLPRRLTHLNKFARLTVIWKRKKKRDPRLTISLFLSSSPCLFQLS